MQPQPLLNQITLQHGIRLRACSWALVLIGLVTFLGLLVAGYGQLAWSSLLQGMLIPTWISLGALFFLSAHSLCGGAWITPVRRLIEGLTSGLPLLVIAFVVLAIFGGPYLYDWIFLDGQAHDALFRPHADSHDVVSPQQWMHAPRWIISNTIFIMVWWAFRARLIGLSLRQDGGGLDITASHVRTSTIFLVVFALTFTLFTWDVLLSLNAHLVSTIWGIYCFTGAVQTFLCVLILFAVWLRKGPLKDIIAAHTLRDLGTWMVAWACFCGYIGFAQFLVIYYGNMDEETIFYLKRFQHGYGYSYILEALLRFGVPFFVLMSQNLRGDPRVLVGVASLVLLGNWIDCSWMIVPAFSPDVFRPFWNLANVLIGGGFTGGFLLLVLAFWSKHGLVVTGDDRLRAIINAEHLH